jgi:hypothetical protein
VSRSHPKSLSDLLPFDSSGLLLPIPIFSLPCQFDFASISLPRLCRSFSSYFYWSNRTRLLRVQSPSLLQNTYPSRSLSYKTSPFPRSYPSRTTARKPWPFIPKMSDSEDDKPLIKGEFLQLPVSIVCPLRNPVPMDSPHFSSSSL